MNNSFALELSSAPRDIRTLSDAFRTFAGRHGIPTDIVFAADLALEEVVANIIFHGYKKCEDQTIVVEVVLLPGELVFRVEDRAPPFNPLQAEPPDLTAAPDEREAGGLGIHLTRRMMDGLDYSNVDGKNVLTMRKRLPAVVAGH